MIGVETKPDLEFLYALLSAIREEERKALEAKAKETVNGSAEEPYRASRVYKLRARAPNNGF